jgi:hypothetical protein
MDQLIKSLNRPLTELAIEELERRLEMSQLPLSALAIDLPPTTDHAQVVVAHCEIHEHGPTHSCAVHDPHCTAHGHICGGHGGHSCVQHGGHTCATHDGHTCGPHGGHSCATHERHCWAHGGFNAHCAGHGAHACVGHGGHTCVGHGGHTCVGHGGHTCVGHEGHCWTHYHCAPHDFHSCAPHGPHCVLHTDRGDAVVIEPAEPGRLSMTGSQ